MKLYLIQVLGDIYPVIRGPYKTEATRDAAAKRFRKSDPEKTNGLFPLDVPSNGTPKAHTYSGGFFEQE